MAGADTKPTSVPRDVQVIQSILKDTGVTDYEPAVVSQLLDFAYRKWLPFFLHCFNEIIVIAFALS